MAQYNLAAGTKFSPFSYERYLAPLAAYNLAVLSQEDVASELAVQADQVRSMANEATDEKAYAQYQKYADDLQALSDLISSKGLYEGSRRAMLDLRNRYALEITPIINAYNRRDEQIKLQRTMRLQHPDIRYGKEASAISLDDYLDNKTLDATTLVASLDLVRKNVAEAASALSREAHANPNIKATLQKILPYQYYAELERTGFKSEDVYKAIHSAEGSPILRGIVDDAIKGVGVDKWDNAKTMYDEFYNYAAPALYNAVGTTKFGPLTDSYGMQYALEEQRNRHAKEQAAAAAAQLLYQTGLPVSTDEISFKGEGTKGADFQKEMHKALGITGTAKGGVTYTDIDLGGKGFLGKAATVAARGLGAITPGGPLVGGLVSHFLGNAVDKATGSWSGITNKNGSTKFRVFDKKGRKLSEAQFVAQGNSKDDQEKLRQYYREKVIPYSQGSNYVGNIYKKGVSAKAADTGTHVSMPSMRFGDNKKTFTDKIGNLVDNMQGAYDITSGINNYTQHKQVDANKLAEKIKNAGDRVSYNVSTENGKEGLVISVGNERYFVPGKNMGSTARNAFSNYLKVGGQYKKMLDYIKSNRPALVSQYGEDYINQAETNYGNAHDYLLTLTLRDVGWDIAGEYANPSAKLFKQE